MSSSRRPESERAVSAVNSKYGWRCSRRAVSAPVNPAAPNTETLAPTDRAFQSVADGGDDRVAHVRHLGVSQRPVGGAEGEPDGERYVAGAELVVVSVDVEHVGVREQRLSALADDAQQLGRADPLGDNDREVLTDLREARQIDVGCGCWIRQRIEVDLECGDDPVKLP